MEKITYNNKLVGILFRNLRDGSVPVTEGSEPLQVVTLKHPKGAYLKAHEHTPAERVTESLQECLIIKKGKIKIDLYDANQKFFQSLTLNTGDFFILMHGGMGINFLEDSELIEVKNGPFIEDKILISTGDNNK